MAKVKSGDDKESRVKGKLNTISLNCHISYENDQGASLDESGQSLELHQQHQDYPWGPQIRIHWTPSPVVNAHCSPQSIRKIAIELCLVKLPRKKESGKERHGGVC